MSARMRPLVLVAAALAAGCSLFKFNVTTPESRRQEEEARQQQAEAARAQADAAEQVAAREAAEAQLVREKQVLAEIEALRAELGAAVTLAKAIAFAEKIVEIQTSHAERKGEVDMNQLRAEAAGYLERGLASEPSYAGFVALIQLPPAPEVDAAVRRACPAVRPLVAGEDLLTFLDVCLARAGGDPKAYKWPTLKADLVAYRKAVAERAAAEAEAARLAAEAEKAAAAEAEKLAKEAERSGLFALAGLFAAGRCEFGDCMKNGWTINTKSGDIRVRCNFSNCLKDGWNADLPGGGTARTRCEFGDCMKDGWTTELPGGGTARTRCNFGKCATDGWTTDMPGGGTARARCNFSDCFKDGWTTDMPDGRTVRCQCNFQKCLTDGTTCS